MTTPMDILRSNLSWVRIPEPTNRIYKHECCVSFDTPMSEGGLYVDMNTFIAFGKEFVIWNYEKTGNPVYLHIKQTKKLIPEEEEEEDRPLKKRATLSTTGVDDGGFDNNDVEYDENYSIVVLPEHATLPFPLLELPEKVRLAVDAILMADQGDTEQIATRVAVKKQVSRYAMNLQQLDNGVVVPPSGWKCAKCGQTDNLWLNLSDGMILCGRKIWDGTGGNNHAVEHYNMTGYPLAVKLGTITADLEAADVYSYSENEGVMDPLLAQHLAFFGIDFSSLQKTEMTTAEKELDQNKKFDWNRIQESEHELEPVFGPGYTGLVNLGNSCYLAATMQVIFSTQSFCSRYYENQNLKTAFEMAPADPTVDLNMQLTKLGHGLLSGKYSTPSKKQEGIPPRMFKAAIDATYHGFSTMRQQDALEFFVHFLNRVERVNATNPELDPSRSFRFGIEDRYLYPSGEVVCSRRLANFLWLNIPLNGATNKEFLKACRHKPKAATDVLYSDQIKRPRVALDACLANFCAPEEVHDLYSSALKAKTTATKTSGLTSFPDYLVIHLNKVVMEAGGWVEKKKLDVDIDVPDVIDISHMRSKGLQPGEEELLPNGEYRLIGVVLSHKDHYVAHINKDGQWVIFNDNKVGVSQDHYKDDGYLYFFQRRDLTD